MPSTHPECQHGPSPGWNLAAVGFAALVVALVIALLNPPAVPAPETQVTYPTSCTNDDRLCRAVEALEEARQDPNLTPAERELVEALDDEVDAVIAGDPEPPPPPPPATALATTSTTTTTTSTTAPPPPPATTAVPRSPRDPGEVLDGILDDLGLSAQQTPPTTIPEATDGDE